MYLFKCQKQIKGHVMYLSKALKILGQDTRIVLHSIIDVCSFYFQEYCTPSFIFIN